METIKALVLYIDPINSGGSVIDTVIAVSGDVSKLQELQSQKESEDTFKSTVDEIDEDGESTWNNIDITSICYNIIDVDVL